MKNEEYVFYQDIKEKKSAARGAFHKKGGSKSKKCTLPSDYLTKKEREKMNGEVKTWKMNEFYTWQEFKQMPDDIQEAYLVSLVGKYKVGIGIIAKYVFKAAASTVYTYLKDKPYRSRLITPERSTKGHINGLLNDLEGLTSKDSADIFIPSGMAPGYCSDGTKVEDAIKEAEEKVNKKLLENGAVSLGEAIDDLKKDLGVPVVADSVHDAISWDLKYEPHNPTITPFKPKPSAVQQATFTIHGWDLELMEYIQDMFRDRDVTINMTVTVND